MIRLISILLVCLLAVPAFWAHHRIYTSNDALSFYVWLLMHRIEGHAGPITGQVIVNGTNNKIDEMDYMPTAEQIEQCLVPQATALCQLAFGVDASQTFKMDGIGSEVCVGMCIGGNYVFATEIK